MKTNDPVRKRGSQPCHIPMTIPPDFEGLRAFLMDYCGTAFAAGAGPALIDLARIEHADPQELLRIAQGLDINVR